MNKTSRLVFIVALLAVLLFGPAASVGAQQAAKQANVSFTMLGRTDEVLNGPYAIVNITFSMPANWAFREGAVLQLLLSSALATETQAAVPDGQYIGATMTVTLDKNAIAVLPLTAGSAVPYQVNIPASALVSPYEDGHHLLSLFLNADLDCDRFLHRTSVIVLAKSQLVLPYDEVSPSTNLTLLPRPIYQRNSVFPVPAYVVVPDGPTPQEMQAALTVAAAFGRMTSGNLPVTVLSVGHLTADVQKSANLILVGKTSFLAKLPAPWSSSALPSTGVQQDDGLLQLIVSPWSPGRSVLVVSGISDLGVVNAAKALSNNNIQTAGRADVAVVASVGAVSPAADQLGVQLSSGSKHTFADLGYDVISLNGTGTVDSLLKFVIPPGMVATSDAYLDLTFSHSPGLDLTASNITVYVNSFSIGGALLGDEKTTTKTQHIQIPSSVLVAGTNQLRIRATMVPLTLCGGQASTSLSVTILPESVLNLPLEPAPVNVSVVRDLSRYPYPFANQPTLSNLAFVLPKDDPAAWNQAAQVAYGIGHGASGAIFDLAAAYDGELTDATRQNRDLIVVGLPSKLKFVNDVGGSLPASFVAGSNTAEVKGQIVSFRFPTDISLGYLQLLASPWSADHTVLLVTGTDANGISLASNALLVPAQQALLRGNLAIINGQNITLIDTRTGLGLAQLTQGNLAQQTIATPSPEPPLPAPATGRLPWILPAIGALLVLMAGVVLLAIFQKRAEKRSR